jgi:hypothetical protein
MQRNVAARCAEAHASSPPRHRPEPPSRAQLPRPPCCSMQKADRESPVCGQPCMPMLSLCPVTLNKKTIRQVWKQILQSYTPLATVVERTVGQRPTGVMLRTRVPSCDRYSNNRQCPQMSTGALSGLSACASPGCLSPWRQVAFRRPWTAVHRVSALPLHARCSQGQRRDTDYDEVTCSFCMCTHDEPLLSTWAAPWFVRTSRW